MSDKSGYASAVVSFLNTKRQCESQLEISRLDLAAKSQLTRQADQFDQQKDNRLHLYRLREQAQQAEFARSQDDESHEHILLEELHRAELARQQRVGGTPWLPGRWIQSRLPAPATSPIVIFDIADDCTATLTTLARQVKLFSQRQAAVERWEIFEDTLGITTDADARSFYVRELRGIPSIVVYQRTIGGRVAIDCVVAGLLPDQLQLTPDGWTIAEARTTWRSLTVFDVTTDPTPQERGFTNALLACHLVLLFDIHLSVIHEQHDPIVLDLLHDVADQTGRVNSEETEVVDAATTLRAEAPKIKRLLIDIRRGAITSSGRDEHGPLPAVTLASPADSQATRLRAEAQ